MIVLNNKERFRVGEYCLIAYLPYIHDDFPYLILGLLQVSGYGFGGGHWDLVPTLRYKGNQGNKY